MSKLTNILSTRRHHKTCFLSSPIHRDKGADVSHSHSQRQKSYVVSCSVTWSHFLKFTSRYPLEYMMLLYSKDLTFFMCHFSFTFLHRVFSNVSTNCLPEKRHSYICCSCLIFLHCAFSSVSSKRLYKKMQSHIGCICLTFSAVHYQMSPQMACPRRGIVTLSHWLHLYDFSLLCILRWLLKLISTDDVYTHLLHLYDFSPSSFVFLKGTPYIFTEVIIYKILIHHHQVPNVVSCLLSVSNWEKKIEQMKMRVIGHWLNKLEKYWDKLAKGWKL